MARSVAFKDSIASRVFYSSVNKHSKNGKFTFKSRHFHTTAKKAQGWKEEETKGSVVYCFGDLSRLKVTKTDAEVI